MAQLEDLKIDPITFKNLAELAKQQFRSPEMQVAYMLDAHYQNEPATFVSVEPSTKVVKPARRSKKGCTLKCNNRTSMSYRVLLAAGICGHNGEEISAELCQNYVTGLEGLLAESLLTHTQRCLSGLMTNDFLTRTLGSHPASYTLSTKGFNKIRKDPEYKKLTEPSVKSLFTP
mgnify:FL=1